MDTFDFDPGNLGDSALVQFATTKLFYLEQNRRAYDIRLDISWRDREERKVAFTVPGRDCCESNPDECDPCERPNPPDSCKDTERPQAVDPNDILGPVGFGPERWIAAAQSAAYAIRFENDPNLATAPAQVVRITQTLDSDFDFRTFRVGDFGFGDLFVDVPDNRAFYTTRIDFTATRGFFVDVAAGIDVATGEAFWELTTIDPATGEVPVDAGQGFLPPNVTGPEGEGFVLYTVKPRRSITTGTRLDAQARIVFDINEPIDTPPIFNTVDPLAPASQVEALPAQVDSMDSSFLVRWSGMDDEGGSALADFTLYVSDSGGEFVPWLTNTTLTESIYPGEPGHTYAFYSIARDNAGNVEEAPSTPDAQTTVGGGEGPRVLDVVDVTPD
ncbi:MAG: hypothetical protein L0Z62_35300, partial [Gemmataceae bacterium]|nr:hypothetical protein [Gemmataceae bacterium]